MLGFLSDNYYLSQCGTLLRKTINKNSDNLIKSSCRSGTLPRKTIEYRFSRGYEQSEYIRHKRSMKIVKI